MSSLDVVNASEFVGLATQVLTAFSERGFTAGEASTADSIADESTITYGPGAQAAAEALARQFNLTTSPSTDVERDTVQLTVGMDFPSADYLIDTADEHKHADHDSSGHPGRYRVGYRDRNTNSRAH